MVYRSSAAVGAQSGKAERLLWSGILMRIEDATKQVKQHTEEINKLFHEQEQNNDENNWDDRPPDVQEHLQHELNRKLI